MVDRKFWNWKILILIGRLIYKHPELRFCQILSILELDKDRFYEEPDKTYNNLLRKASALKI
jgi:hypothetical protein